MLANFKAYASFSTSDLESTKDFYINKLGLDIVHENDGAVTFKTGGDTQFMVYYKPDHKAAEFTVLNFEVSDVKQLVNDLKEKEVIMEKYPEMGTDEDGISTNEYVTMAWFKDPSGNIIALMQI